VSKHWTPPSHTAALKRSRIRRDPVRLVSDIPSKRKVIRRTDGEETWFGIAGVMLFTAVIAVAIVGVAWATLLKDDPAAAAAEARFGQCYNGGPNCVIDGDTIYVGGRKVEIAGLVAPQIQGASCDAERDGGINASVKLMNLLNSGNVSVSPAFTDELGRPVRTVSVKGKDVARTMIKAGVAKKVNPEKPPSWC
jgi:endonuclease YncB( thermonuclease family)